MSLIFLWSLSFGSWLTMPVAQLLVVRPLCMRQTFPEFVRMRRRWFLIVLAVVSVGCLLFAAVRFRSSAEIVGFTLVGGLVGTTAVSIVSIPFVWFLARRRVVSSQSPVLHKKL